MNDAAIRAMGLGKLIALEVAQEMLEISSQQSAVSAQPLEGIGEAAGTNFEEERDTMQLRETAEPAGEKFLSAHHLGMREWIELPLPTRVPVYGEPLHLAAMAHAPTNEGGVLFLFGVLAESLGYRIERIQAAFPDCEAKRQIRPGVWERVRIEFEFESRGFREHRHDVTGCDVIVCWRHNWPECPEGIEVVELRQCIG